MTKKKIWSFTCKIESVYTKLYTLHSPDPVPIPVILSSYVLQVIDREDRVAFIGISNWPLDPAEMNRGIMVTICDPDERELTESAK